MLLLKFYSTQNFLPSCHSLSFNQLTLKKMEFRKKPSKLTNCKLISYASELCMYSLVSQSLAWRKKTFELWRCLVVFVALPWPDLDENCVNIMATFRISWLFASFELSVRATCFPLSYYVKIELCYVLCIY